MVEIKGEVVYPGKYLISPNEALSSVIERAGGFTNESFINAAIFTRESVKQKEREQLLVLGNNIRRDQASRPMTKGVGRLSSYFKRNRGGHSSIIIN